MADLRSISAAQPPEAAAATRHGVALTFETIAACERRPAPLRLYPREHTLLRVIGGVLRLTVDGAHRHLCIGEEAILPAGTPHRLAGVDGDARVVIGFRPGRATARSSA